MLEEAKKKKKLSKQEQLRQFWANYPVEINPEIKPPPNGMSKSTVNWSGSPSFPQYTSESLTSKIILKNRQSNIMTSINEAIDLIEYNQLTEDLKDLFRDHVYKIINEKKTAHFSIDSKLDGKQKQAAYNLIALSAMASLIASRVLIDKSFFKRNQSLNARFADALQRAVNVAASDPGIIQKIRQNSRKMSLITTEEVQIMESFTKPNFTSKNTGIPLIILKNTYENAVKAYKHGVKATRI